MRAGDDLESGKLAAANMRAQFRDAFTHGRPRVTIERAGEVSIAWEDGPTEATVRELVDRYELKGQPTDWQRQFGGVMRLTVRRVLTASTVEVAIRHVFTRFAANLIGVDRPTAADYFAGQLVFVTVEGIERQPGVPLDLQSAVRDQAAATTMNR